MGNTTHSELAVLQHRERKPHTSQYFNKVMATCLVWLGCIAVIQIQSYAQLTPTKADSLKNAMPLIPVNERPPVYEALLSYFKNDSLKSQLLKALWLYDQGKYKESEALALRVLKYTSAGDGKSYQIASEACYHLSKIYFLARNIPAATKYERLSSRLDDSLVHENHLALARQVEKKYEVERKQQENELLKRDQLMKETTIKRQQVIAASAIVLIMLFAGIIFSLYRSIRLRNKTKSLLQQRNEEIAAQKEDLEAKSRDLEQKNQQLEQTLTELRETQHYLVQTEKMASLGQLTAGIAHEINNPVNFILGSVDGLKLSMEDLVGSLHAHKRSHISENIKDIELLADSMERGASRTSIIVEGLAKFGYTTASAWNNVDVNASIESALVLVQPPKRIQVRRHLAQDLPQVQGIASEIHQALINIFRNAVQAMEDTGGHLDITTNKDGADTMVICIKDSGHGIPKELLAKIFDPFFTTRDVGKGAGLGLSIAYKIIERHGGMIIIKSEPGKGSHVMITLPIRQPIGDR
jgi:C4-dicarboxylate-specific signal transduction histidine kinase